MGLHGSILEKRVGTIADDLYIQHDSSIVKQNRLSDAGRNQLSDGSATSLTDARHRAVSSCLTTGRTQPFVWVYDADTETPFRRANSTACDLLANE